MPPVPLIDWTLVGALGVAVTALATVCTYLFFLYVGVRNRHETKLESLYIELLPKITAYAAAAERLSANAEKLLEVALQLRLGKP